MTKRDGRFSCLVRPMTIADYIALALFALLWAIYSWITAGSGARFFPRASLNRAMAERRKRWIYNSLRRDLKMIDTQILAGLQNGTAFFASTSIFAIGGCFALLGATDQVEAVFSNLPLVAYSGRTAFEIKVAGLTFLFGYAFFKFGWSYRLFNYCTILFGALPMMSDTNIDPAAAERAADQVVRMNTIAAKHFNAGLRALFLSIGYLGWFAGPYMFMAMTLFVIFVLTRRQYFSEARLAIMDRDIL
ncbi:putative membrane protein [Rhizobium petrolearium]|nr:putative membrane protein [Neorhizobium petrolearium]